MGIPNKSSVGLIADSIVYCFPLAALNISPANEHNSVHSVDDLFLDRTIQEVPRQCKLQIHNTYKSKFSRL
jgi:hypothetical protein